MTTTEVYIYLPSALYIYLPSALYRMTTTELYIYMPSALHRMTTMDFGMHNAHYPQPLYTPHLFNNVVEVMVSSSATLLGIWVRGAGMACCV